MQDAFNLGWKLAAVVNGETPEELLNTYHDERHAVGSETLNVIRGQVALLALGDPMTQLRNVFRRLIDLSEVNTYLGDMLSGLDIRYPLGDGHLLLGRRVPDVNIRSGPTTSRIYDLLHLGRAVVLDLSGSDQLRAATAGWEGRVNVIQASCSPEPWTVPGAGAVSAPTALLIRPDGYVSWVNGGSQALARLQESLITWHGPRAHA
jgi:hypothetical protein